MKLYWMIKNRCLKSKKLDKYRSMDEEQVGKRTG
jgi:hypothetical protein